jgi:hypothetical protein
MSLSSFINQLLAPTGTVIMRRSVATNLASSKPSTSLADIKGMIAEAQRTILRHQISAKWNTVDFVLKSSLKDDQRRVCPLCSYKGSDRHFGRVQSHCIFGGGDLLRYICPACEVTFGPDKMFDLTSAQLTEDYEWHYRVYDEGDSSELELRTFFALNPDKDGLYLNYGAGGWSTSVQQLRALGWKVYAYEPHAAASKSVSDDWLFCSRKQLQLMRFDGIFSNNVLEHLRHPVQELQYMQGLLREGGLMAHSTPCFEYLYEYTRFHLYFFTGKSKSFLMQEAGLYLIDEVNDGDFICKVMKCSTSPLVSM